MASQTQREQVPIPKLNPTTNELQELINQLNTILIRQESQNQAFHDDIKTLISRTNTHGI